MSTENGGPAFPYHEDLSRGTNHLGMTLRDYFAAKAMQSILTGVITRGIDTHEKHGAIFAQLSYTMADAMLKERSK